MAAGTSFKCDGKNIEKELFSGGFDPNFLLMVSMGRVPGCTPVGKFGVNLEITTNTDPEDIIEQGGRVQWDTNETAPIKYISSSSALDTGQLIAIEGLDIDGSFVSQTATTNGQSNVELTTPLWRQFRMENDDDTLDIQGVLYCHTDASPTAGVPADTNIRTIINGDKNQTLYCAYTIPSGKVGFVVRGEVGPELEGNGAALAEYAHFHWEVRKHGKLFKVKKALSTVVSSGSYKDNRTFPDPLPGKTDLTLTAETVSMTLGVWATFDILLVDEDLLSNEFLETIGQPGY